MENEAFIERLTKAEDAVKSAQRQINEIKELISSIHELASEVRHMRSDLNRLQVDIDALRSKPLRRYEMIITAAVSSLVSVMVGFIFSSVI